MHPATHAVASDVQLGGIKSGLQLLKRFHEEFPGPVWIETPDVGHLSVKSIATAWVQPGAIGSPADSGSGGYQFQ